MGVFWVSLGFIFYTPSGVLSSYSTTGGSDLASLLEGVSSPGFNGDFALWLVGWGLTIFIILVCSIRTNITFIILFAILDAGLFIFAASHFQTAAGNPDTANILTKVLVPLL
jgi:uncharacterized protein